MDVLKDLLMSMRINNHMINSRGGVSLLLTFCLTELSEGKWRDH
jgi:hypothetical protein